jgi:hypothetical protein
LTVFSKGYRTGDWALSTSIDYFMDLYEDDRFQTVYARDVHVVLDRAPEGHFWVGYFDLEEFPQASPAEVLANNGYRLAETLVIQEQNDRLVLVQVRRE